MFDKRLLKEMPRAKIYIWKHVALQWLSLLCNVGIVMLLAAVFVHVYDKTLEIQQVWYMSGGILALLAIRMIAAKAASAYAYAASCDVKDELRTRLYKKLLLMKNAYQEYSNTSELIQLNVEGIDQLETYFGKYLPQFFYSMMAPITLFIILIWLDVKSAVVLLICVPLIPISIVAVQKFAKKLLSKYWSSYATLGDSFLENLQGLTTLKIYQADEYKNKKMNEEAENFRKITMRVLTMQLNSVSVMDLIAYGGAAIGSIIAISGYLHGNVSLFGVICIVLLSSEFFIPLRLLGSFFHIAMNGIAASAKIFRILDMPIEENGQVTFTKDDISICLEDVTFAYEQERTILHNLSMKISPKQFIGIVGESGSGKSTIAKLLTGYAKQYDGHILMQGKERKTIDDNSFYDRFVYVTHKPTIIKGTIRENLLLGNPEASDEACYQVLEQTCLKEFIEAQGGLTMPIKENGNNLSGGQKQRLSLARAILANRDIYIFDEATSNIDIESEEAILKVIMELTKNKTVIMITHRLHNIVESDQIYVLKQGVCVEHGNHTALMDAKKQYYDMYSKQLELESMEGDLTYA